MPDPDPELGSCLETEPLSATSPPLRPLSALLNFLPGCFKDHLPGYSLLLDFLLEGAALDWNELYCKQTAPDKFQAFRLCAVSLAIALLQVPLSKLGTKFCQPQQSQPQCEPYDKNIPKDCSGLIVLGFCNLLEMQRKRQLYSTTVHCEFHYAFKHLVVYAPCKNASLGDSEVNPKSPGLVDAIELKLLQIETEQQRLQLVSKLFRANSYGLRRQIVGAMVELGAEQSSAKLQVREFLLSPLQCTARLRLLGLTVSSHCLPQLLIDSKTVFTQPSFSIGFDTYLAIAESQSLVRNRGEGSLPSAVHWGINFEARLSLIFQEELDPKVGRLFEDLQLLPIQLAVSYFGLQGMLRGVSEQSQQLFLAAGLIIQRQFISHIAARGLGPDLWEMLMLDSLLSLLEMNRRLEEAKQLREELYPVQDLLVQLSGLSENEHLAYIQKNVPFLRARSGIRIWKKDLAALLNQLQNGSQSESSYSIRSNLKQGRRRKPIQQLRLWDKSRIYDKRPGSLLAWGKGYGRVPRVVTGLRHQIVVQVSCSLGHVAAVNYFGQVFCWGLNSSGQLGKPPTSKQINQPTIVEGAKGILETCCGYQTTFLIDRSGSVFGMGDPALTGTSQPSEVIKLVRRVRLQKASRICSGGYHALALVQGRVFGWGRSEGGQLCCNQGLVQEPIAMPIEDNIESISAGEAHSFAVGKTGRCWGWGYGKQGQLGVQLEGGVTSKPVQVLGRMGIKEACAGSTFSLLLNSEGRLYGCGFNDSMQTGVDLPRVFKRGAKKPTIKECIEIAEPKRINGLQHMEVLLVRAGLSHAAAFCRCNSIPLLFSWGSNQAGELGLGPEGGSRIRSVSQLSGIWVEDMALGECVSYATVGRMPWGQLSHEQEQELEWLE